MDVIFQMNRLNFVIFPALGEELYMRLARAERPRDARSACWLLLTSSLCLACSTRLDHEGLVNDSASGKDRAARPHDSANDRAECRYPLACLRVD